LTFFLQIHKDASMLEAFGTGASEEMESCKRVISSQVGARGLVGREGTTEANWIA
jgi:hypothetical protein